MYNESFVPSVGKSFYDAKKGSLGDPQKEFLNQTQQEAQGLGKRLPIPRFYELIEKVPFTVGYENGNPALTFTYVTTPYGVFPIQSGYKKPTKKENPSQKNEDNSDDNNKHNQNQNEDPKNDTPEPNKNNALICIMQRRKNLHMVLVILLILIVIILLLKHN